MGSHGGLQDDKQAVLDKQAPWNDPSQIFPDHFSISQGHEGRNKDKIQ